MMRRAAALEKCAADTKGQTCYICMEALHWKTKEGLVRMCACRGTAGFAHVSCLAEQAKILNDEAKDNNKASQWRRWDTCSLCEQDYHGVVLCALEWACWRTYLGRPEEDFTRQAAVNVLGNGLYAAKHYEDALSVGEAELSMKCPVPLTVRGTQALVGFAPLAPSVFCAARQNAVLRRSLLRPT